MASVRISTKYPISAEDVVLLQPNKTTWWMRNTTTGTFVKEFPRIPCTEAFDLMIELPEGNEFTIGCGDYNVVNDAGKHISQKIYGYVKDGQFRYCKRNELPSVTGSAQATLGGFTSDGGYNPFGTNTPVANTAPKLDVTEVEGQLYCVDSGKFVLPEYNCVTSYCPKDSTGLEDCSTCVHGRTIFYSNQA